MHLVRYITTFLIAASSFLLGSGKKVRADHLHTIDFETTNTNTTPADDAAVAAQTYAYTYQDLTITFEANYVDDSVGNSNLAFEDYGYSATDSSATSETRSGYNFATSTQGGYPSATFSFPSGALIPSLQFMVSTSDYFMRSGCGDEHHSHRQLRFR